MADRFWVGNGGNWSDATNHWATSSGGAPGVGNLPTSADNAYFDANSFSSASQTVTVTAGATCKNFIWTGATNSPTLAGSNVVTVNGDCTFISAMTCSLNQYIVLKGYDVTHTLTTNGLSFSAGLGIEGHYQFADDVTCNGLFYIYIPGGGGLHGILTTNNHTVNCNLFYSPYGAALRDIHLGTSTINCKQVQMGTAADNTGLLWDAANAVFNVSDGSIFEGGGLDYNEVNFNVGNYTLKTSCSFSKLTFSAGKTYTFTASTTTTVTSAGGVVWNGTSGNLITLQSSSAGTAYTISVASGTVECDYLSLKDCTAAGGAFFYAGNNSVNVSGNTRWLFIDASEHPLPLSTVGSSIIELQFDQSTDYSQAIPLAGVKRVMFYVTVESAEAGTAAFTVEVSADGSTWVAYNKLIDNVTNAITETLTRVATKSTDAAFRGILSMDLLHDTFAYIRAKSTQGASIADTVILALEYEREEEE